MRRKVTALLILIAMNIPYFSFVIFVILLAVTVFFLLEKAYEANK